MKIVSFIFLINNERRRRRCYMNKFRNILNLLLLDIHFEMLHCKLNTVPMCLVDCIIKVL